MDPGDRSQLSRSDHSDLRRRSRGPYQRPPRSHSIYFCCFLIRGGAIMAPQLSRYTMLKSARRRRSPNAVRLSCERLEDRVTPSLFNVQNPPLAPSGFNNNGCVVVSDFNKDGLSDAVMTNFGTDYGAGAGTTITL